ncbi:magnesium transporter NIPA [Homoserinimonas aerilata]|uniref:Magnesium transporter NIPA n=1 Tax=Homoserinimonas aerilata TaxID=1162970 RepID=A0A542YIG6_9MICO|nr:DMT family transporter [Homoserinimonas aerilata]TQL47873.1 magnesium transporter NIPA [Homoserinimonas aerilata]
MLPDLTELAMESLTPMQALGIPVALIGAVFLAVGAQLQHRGVGKVEAQIAPPVRTAGLSLRQMAALVARPSWLIGTLMLGLAVVFQLTSLALAPLTVVQPLGAVALVITAVLNARVSNVRLDAASIRAVAFCVGGVALFVTIASFTTTSRRVSDAQVFVILAILAVVLVALAALFLAYRHRFKAIMYIVGAGVVYGFVATLAKVVIDRVKTGDFEWLTLTCVVALLVATVLGGYFVQNAYSSGPPDLVIAGLTVIDPIVAVLIGILVLREADGAHWTIMFAFLVAGAMAVYGVFQLAKYHPQTRH